MTPQRQRLQLLILGVLLAFAAISLALAYWATLSVPRLTEREDNPRLVEAELRIQRGAIVDSYEVVLAQTILNGEIAQRFYPIPQIGPAVGYYSLKYGTAGIEAGFDDLLRGSTDDWWLLMQRQLLKTPQVGQDVRLTLDANWQVTTDNLLGGEQGAVLLLSLSDGAIRVMASRPSFDPNQLDEQFAQLVEDEGAPLINRVTQGQYQPGLVLQPFLLATLMSQGELALASPITNSTTPVAILGHSLVCASEPPTPSQWVDVLRHACPAPMLSIANNFDSEELQAVFAHWGFVDSPDLPIVTELPAIALPVDLSRAVLGQENLTVTPLQVGLAWMALGNKGLFLQPRLVTAVRDSAGIWQTYTQTSAPRSLLPTSIAQAILASLPRHESIIEHATIALAGPQNNTHAWYLGLTPANDPQLAVVVVIENSRNLLIPQTIGRSLLTNIFSNEN